MTPENPRAIQGPKLKAKDLMAAVKRFLGEAGELQVWQKEFGLFFQNLPPSRGGEIRIYCLEFTGEGDYDSQETHHYPAVTDFNGQTGKPITKFVARADSWAEGEKPIKLEIVDYSYGQAKEVVVEKKERRRKRELCPFPEVRPGYSHPLTGIHYPEAQVVVTEIWTTSLDWKRNRKSGHQREVVELKAWSPGSSEPREWDCLEISRFETLSPKKKWPTWKETERVFPVDGDLVGYRCGQDGRMILATPEEKGPKDKRRELPQNLGNAREVRY